MFTALWLLACQALRYPDPSPDDCSAVPLPVVDPRIFVTNRHHDRASSCSPEAGKKVETQQSAMSSFTLICLWA